MNLIELARLRHCRTERFSSYDVTGRNRDAWTIPARQSRVLADVKGPGLITHLWMTQRNHYRECLIKITWDNALGPSVLCPLGDFFGLGHGMVNSYQSLLFSASASERCKFDGGCALNCYVPMPFRQRALIELINESDEPHNQYFYIDYEAASLADIRELAYFHAEFRRANPFGGWGPELGVSATHTNAANKERTAWRNNYVILETRGRGHYIGCNLSVSNFQGTWWGEGDDMIWVDGYKWPPDLHGTGSEDYFNQAWGMQPNAFLRNGSSIFEGHTLPVRTKLWQGKRGGYQTSYVFHVENPVRFRKEIKVTIEHGHANHLANEMSSVAYWYAATPTPVVAPPPVAQRAPVKQAGNRWIFDQSNQCPAKPVTMTDEMRSLKAQWPRARQISSTGRLSPRHSRFVTAWKCSRLLPARNVSEVPCARLADKLDWKILRADHDLPSIERYFVNVHARFGNRDGVVYLANRFRVSHPGSWIIELGHDGGARLFVDSKSVLCEPKRVNPAPPRRSQAAAELSRGDHEIVIAFDTDSGNGWGFYFSFAIPSRKTGRKAPPSRFPIPVEVRA